jgi:hypothetical protein
VRSEQSDGRVGVIEMAVPAGWAARRSGGFERRFDSEPRKPYPRATLVGPPIEP